MSVRVMSWVWSSSRSMGTDRLVLLAIADCASDDGANAYPSMAELVRKTGLSERSVQRALIRLEESKELVTNRNAGPRGCNRYRVVMTPVRMTPPSDSHPRQDDTPVTMTGEPPSDCRPTPVRMTPGTVLEPSVEPSETSSRRTRKRADPDEDSRPDVDRVCAHLADAIEANGSKRPAVGKRWHNAARLLIDKDGRTEDQIIRAIDWCQGNEFWRGNVLSMPKLREQYDRLRLAAQRNGCRTSPNGIKPSTTDQRVAQAREVGRRLQAAADAQAQQREIMA